MRRHSCAVVPAAPGPRISSSSAAIADAASSSRSMSFCAQIPCTNQHGMRLTNRLQGHLAWHHVWAAVERRTSELLVMVHDAGPKSRLPNALHEVWFRTCACWSLLLCPLPGVCGRETVRGALLVAVCCSSCFCLWHSGSGGPPAGACATDSIITAHRLRVRSEGIDSTRVRPPDGLSTHLTRLGRHRPWLLIGCCVFCVPPNNIHGGVKPPRHVLCTSWLASGRMSQLMHAMAQALTHT